MMREVVDDRHTVYDGLYLQAPLDTREALQSLLDRCQFHALARSQCRRCSRVQRIVLTGHGQNKLTPFHAAAQYVPTGVTLFLRKSGKLPMRTGDKPVSLYRTKCFCNTFGYIL